MLLAFIYSILVIIVLGFLYKWMIDRESPLKIPKAQAIVPVVLGIFSLPLSFAILLLFGYIFHNVFGLTLGDGPLLFASFSTALFAAGLNEELAKLIFTLIAVFIFRKSIKNVYEYILIGGAVGFGFTIVEEYIYSSGVIGLVLRAATITVHMMLGFAMGRHLGLARYNKVTGSGPVWREYLLAYIVPVAVHTLYDALVVNKLLSSDDEMTAFIGVVMALVALVLTIVLQVYVVKRLKSPGTVLTDLTKMSEGTSP